MPTVANLLQHAQRPECYARTDARFWDDPHISQHMLEAHLNPETDAASRKPDFIERSAAWIASLVKPDARVLDLGCGPGLYTRRFAACGMDVTGVDLSSRSIAYAEAHDPQSRYLVQNYLALEVEGPFDLVTMIWCDYGALVPDERALLLDRVHAVLKPGGLFALDVFAPAHAANQIESTSWERAESGGFWSPDPHLVLAATYTYQDMVDLHRYVVVEQHGIREVNIWNTCFSPASLAAEIAPHGFAVVDVFSDIAGTPWQEDSNTLCAVLRKLVG